MCVPLLVACDWTETLAVAARSGADALVLDLGGSSDVAARRALVRAVRVVVGAKRPRLIPLIAPLRSAAIEDDLDAVMAGAPDAVLLPEVAGARDVQHLAAKLAVREAEHGLAPGSTRIVAFPADTARGVLALSTLPGAGPRLLAVAWDGKALARSLGAAGNDAGPCQLARAGLIVAAAAAGVPAIDFAAVGDGEALAQACAAARRDGFSGLLARRPDQVAAIRACFDGRE